MPWIATLETKGIALGEGLSPVAAGQTEAEAIAALRAELAQLLNTLAAGDQGMSSDPFDHEAIAEAVRLEKLFVGAATDVLEGTGERGRVRLYADPDGSKGHIVAQHRPRASIVVQ